MGRPFGFGGSQANQAIFPRDEAFHRVQKSAREAVYMEILRHPVPESFERVASVSTSQHSKGQHANTSANTNANINREKQRGSGHNFPSIYTLSRFVEELRMERDTAKRLLETISTRLGIEIRNENGGYSIPHEVVQLAYKARQLYRENQDKFVSLSHAAQFILDEIQNPFPFSKSMEVSDEIKEGAERILKRLEQLEKRLDSISAVTAVIAKFCEDFDVLRSEVSQFLSRLGIKAEGSNNANANVSTSRSKL